MERIELAGLDLNLLVALDRLLARASVTAAARDLGITQPAMSRTLQRLRDVLRDPLLVRVGRTMAPTERARALEAPLAHALEAVGRVFARPEAFDPATARGPFVLAFGDETQVAFADAVVAAIRERAPGIDVRFRTLSTTASPDQARRGQIDLGLAPDLSVLPPTAGVVDLSEYVARTVYRRSFVVVGRHPPEDLEGYCAADHVLVSFDGTARGFVDDLLERHGRKRHVAVVVSSFHAAARLAARTDLVATLPDDVARTAGVRLRIVAPPVRVPALEMQLLWPPWRTQDPRHRFLRERVREAVQGCLAAR